MRSLVLGVACAIALVLTGLLPSASVKAHPGETQQASIDENGLPATGLDSAISGNATVVAFVSFEPLASEDTDDDADLYLRDRVNDSTTLIAPPYELGDPDSSFTADPDISADGSRDR